MLRQLLNETKWEGQDSIKHGNRTHFRREKENQRLEFYLWYLAQRMRIYAKIATVRERPVTVRLLGKMAHTFTQKDYSEGASNALELKLHMQNIIQILSHFSAAKYRILRKPNCLYQVPCSSKARLKLHPAVMNLRHSSQ